MRAASTLGHLQNMMHSYGSNDGHTAVDAFVPALPLLLGGNRPFDARNLGTRQVHSGNEINYPTSMRCHHYLSKLISSGGSLDPFLHIPKPNRTVILMRDDQSNCSPFRFVCSQYQTT